ncbi:MAG: 6-phosphogluconolactonase [Verrucomicrobia bacterium]|nr:6-phosphogluconolactonase [Verrucomicrobiota bacterium]
MMKPEIFPDHEVMSRAAANWLARELKRTPDALLCLATGGTPTRAYDLLAEKRHAQPGLFRKLRVLKLDEWGGLAMDDPATCEAHLQHHIVQPLKLGRRYFGFESQPRDAQAECARVNEWLTANGPIGVCVLGLGVNGHLAFNEPAAFLRPHAHVATLSCASLRHAMLNETNERPKFGLTLGMASLLQARKILLVVSGASKRAPIQKLLSGEITPRFPASFLWLHPNVVLLCDEAARDKE